jgi:peptidoglycan-N-acetylglucosamine deacetylase
MIRSILAALSLIGAALAAPNSAMADIITHLNTTDKVVALTFDACEAGQKMRLDSKIADILTARKIPYTIFMSGRFARDNSAVVAKLAQSPLVEIENHTWSHPPDLRKLNDQAVATQITRAQQEIQAITGRRTQLFRFPGGNVDTRTLKVAEDLGYKVVHWRWPEGDPDPNVTARGMIAQTLSRTRPGDILIFHINGRGVHTAEALPGILDGLQARGFRFVLVSDYIRP